MAFFTHPMNSGGYPGDCLLTEPEDNALHVQVYAPEGSRLFGIYSLAAGLHQRACGPLGIP